jgi:hydrogenase-4 membrane subunit HyfE
MAAQLAAEIVMPVPVAVQLADSVNSLVAALMLKMCAFAGMPVPVTIMPGVSRVVEMFATTALPLVVFPVNV